MKYPVWVERVERLLGFADEEMMAEWDAAGMEYHIHQWHAHRIRIPVHRIRLTTDGLIEAVGNETSQMMDRMRNRALAVEEAEVALQEYADGMREDALSDSRDDDDYEPGKRWAS